MTPPTPNSPARSQSASAEGVAIPVIRLRNRLFVKYVALFIAVVGVALLSNGVFEVFFYHREHQAALIRIQREQAEAAAAKISQFVKEIENQIGWTAQLPWSGGSLEQRRFDALRLLRQVPAITELTQIDSAGKERLRVSRLTMDVMDSGIDHSGDPKFAEAVAHKVYYGPVYFRSESEPYMTLSLAGTRKDAGVSVAEVNLKLIWDIVSQIKVGERGHAYVVGPQGRLIAHPDISLVLRNTNMSELPQVHAAQAGDLVDTSPGSSDIKGREVLAASAPIAPLGWTMFVELPLEEAYASLYASLERLGLVLLGALIFAVLAGMFLAKRMVGPIQELRAGATRIGASDFSQVISVKTGDELQGLAEQFNDMGARLRDSYADLEQKVETRTAELSETLQQQTATSEVLAVISRSPSDLAPVLNAIADTAARLCGSQQTMFFRFDGEVFRILASWNFPLDVQEMLEQRPVAPGHPSAIGRAGATLSPAYIPDVLADPGYGLKAEQGRALYRSTLAVPLLREGRLIGALSLNRSEPDAFTHKHIELVTTFADQAVIAIENVRLFDEVQAKTRDLSEALVYQTGSSNILRVIASSPTDVRPVLQAIVDSACELCDTDDAAVLLKDGEALRFSAHHGSISINQEAWPINRGWAAGRAYLDREPVHVPDIFGDEGDEFPDARELSRRSGSLGIRSVLAVPLLWEEASVGAILLRSTEVRPFSDKQIALLQTFADQAVIAIGNVQLFDEVQARTKELSQSLQDLHAAQDRLIQSEKLASLGQLTAGIAHEIKNPLNFVNNFSSLSSELLDELLELLGPATLDEKTRAEVDELTGMLKSNLEKVVQHGKRADSIVKNMLLHSREGSGEHRPVEINAIIEESLNLAYHGARAEKPDFNVTLDRRLDPEAGMIDLYPQEMTRVFLNLISNGFYAADKRKSDGGAADFQPTLSASTRNLGEAVEIRIRDNGSGVPPEVKEKMFHPFFTTKPAGEGTGLGLSMSHDIVVKQHGGTIEVETQLGVFTEFIIRLPRTAAANPGKPT